MYYQNKNNMEKKLEAPIDNKNFCEDFIYELFDYNYLQTPKHNNIVGNILGYHEGNLLEVRWSIGSNRICFAFVSTNENHVNYITELPKFKDYFEEMITINNEELILESFISGNWLICDFYWKQ